MRDPNTGRYQQQYRIDEEFFDIIGDEQAWLLGLLAADGCVHGVRAFSLSQSGEHGLSLLQQVQLMLRHDGRITTFENSHSITITSPGTVCRLADYGIVPRKSLIYDFPQALLPEYYSPFLRGYIEGDGSVGIYSTAKTHVLIISLVGTPAFIQTSSEVAPVKGIITPISRASNLSELRYTGAKAVTFGQWVWANASLPCTRKSAKLGQFLSLHQPRYIRYAAKKEQAQDLLRQGMPPMRVAVTVGVPFQTIYLWMKKWGIGCWIKPVSPDRRASREI